MSCTSGGGKARARQISCRPRAWVLPHTSKRLEQAPLRVSIFTCQGCTGRRARMSTQTHWFYRSVLVGAPFRARGAASTAGAGRRAPLLHPPPPLLKQKRLPMQMAPARPHNQRRCASRSASRAHTRAGPRGRWGARTRSAAPPTTRPPSAPPDRTPAPPPARYPPPSARRR